MLGVPNESLFGEALEKTEICVLRQKDFSELLLHYPALSLKLLAINAEKLTKVQQQTTFLMMEKVEERVAVYLLDLAKATGKNQMCIRDRCSASSSNCTRSRETRIRTRRR